jgi:hypothetical protein
MYSAKLPIDIYGLSRVTSGFGILDKIIVQPATQAQVLQSLTSFNAVSRTESGILELL